MISWASLMTLSNMTSTEPFELLLTKEANGKSNIVCQRFFCIKKADLSQLDSLRVAKAMKRCSEMIGEALADASFLFQMENNSIHTVQSLSNIKEVTCGDVLYVISEDKFYGWSKGECKVIENDGEYRVLLPAPNPEHLLLTLYFTGPNGNRRLICQTILDISIYPRYITGKVDITGKHKYWEGARLLIPTLLKEIGNQISSKALKKARKMGLLDNDSTWYDY